MERVLKGILDATKSDLERMIGVNLVGSFLGAKHDARVMIPQRKGCILFIVSACASIAGLSTHSYAASKYAVFGLSKNLTPDSGKYGIRVNCVPPYGVITGTVITEDTRQQLEETVSNMGNLKGKNSQASKCGMGCPSWNLLASFLSSRLNLTCNESSGKRRRELFFKPNGSECTTRSVF
ncbi:hypothetical protein CRYUN_Cryun08bG0120800 [Craigia yunnanensis]